jgi:hypothetical protein
MPKNGRIAMQCPVCHGRAENLTPNTLDGVVVGCSACGPYRVAGGALHDLMRLEREARMKALEVAKRSSRGGWPMISASCLGSG